MGLGSKFAVNYYANQSKEYLESDEAKEDKEETDQTLEKNKLCLSNGCRCLLGCTYAETKECKRFNNK